MKQVFWWGDGQKMKQAETALGRGEYHKNTEQGKGSSNFR